MLERRGTRNQPTARRHRILGHGYFSRLGPGLVTGAADDDPSGIGTYSQVGAAFGYGLLWSTFAVAPMAAAVQETAARLGLATGKGLATLIRENFARPLLYGALVLTLVANTFNIGADVAAMASATQLVIDLPTALLAILITGVMLGLELAVPYHRYARILRWLALSLLAYVLVMLTIDVDWHAVLNGIVSPEVTLDRPELAALIAVFGTTVSPYLFFWQASEEVEEEHDAATDHAEATDHADTPGPLTGEHVTAMRVDVIGGMVSAVAIAFAIMVVAASTLHPAGITTVATANQAADALRPLAGDLAGALFALGIVGLGLLAVPVLAGSSAYALSEALAWREGLAGRLRDERGFYTVLVASMSGGAILGLFGLDPIRALYYSAILNGLAAPPLIVLMLILARDKRVCGGHSSHRISTALLVLTICVSILLPVLYLVAS